MEPTAEYAHEVPTTEPGGTMKIDTTQPDQSFAYYRPQHMISLMNDVKEIICLNEDASDEDIQGYVATMRAFLETIKNDYENRYGLYEA